MKLSPIGLLPRFTAEITIYPYSMRSQFIILHRDRFLLLVFPLVLTFLNSNWIFTPVTNYIPDPWFYVGYFRYFYDYVGHFPSNTHYFVERLTWNVPGHYLYKIFTPLQANYILHLLVFYAAVFSLYGILNLLFNRRAALIGALLLGAYPWFLRAAGWDYTDGTGIAHMLLLVFLITKAMFSKGWRLCFGLAGTAYASLLITNPFWLGFTGAWLIYFLVLNLQIKKFDLRQIILPAAYFLFGSLIMLSLAGLFYGLATGNYLFFTNSVRFSVILTADEGNRNSVVTIYGHMRPYWHLLPAIVAIVATSQMVFSERVRNNYSQVAIYLLFMAGYGWLVFWHFYSIPLLTVFTYSSYTIPSLFLLGGALLSTRLDGLSKEQFAVLTGTCIGLLLLPMFILVIFPSLEQLQGDQMLIACLSVTLLVLLFRPFSMRLSVITIFVLSLLFYTVGEKSYVYVSDRSYGRDHFMSIIRASDILDSYYPNHTYKEFYLWFRSDEDYDTFFSLASLYLYPWGSALGRPFSREEPPDQLHLVERDVLNNSDNIVILSSNPKSEEVLAEANRALLSRNAGLTLKKTEQIHQGSAQFFLYFTTVRTLD